MSVTSDLAARLCDLANVAEPREKRLERIEAELLGFRMRTLDEAVWAVQDCPVEAATEQEYDVLTRAEEAIRARKRKEASR